MEKMKCLIIEDEPLAAEILQDYIAEVPYLELSGTVSDAFKAMAFLQHKKIDVVFLDVNLPKLKGTDFLKTLKHPCQVIISTAYRDYALDGYELNVVDFLLKPVSLKRFLIAVSKLNVKMPYADNQTTVATNFHEKGHMFINVNKKKIKIYFDDILFIESKREYINIVTKEKSYLTKLALTELEELLTKNNFIRIHRSFIISKTKITAYTATDVEIGGFEIPIGRNYKERVLTMLE